MEASGRQGRGSKAAVKALDQEALSQTNERHETDGEHQVVAPRKASLGEAEERFLCFHLQSKNLSKKIFLEKLFFE